MARLGGNTIAAWARAGLLLAWLPLLPACDGRVESHAPEALSPGAGESLDPGESPPGEEEPPFEPPITPPGEDPPEPPIPPEPPVPTYDCSVPWAPASRVLFEQPKDATLAKNLVVNPDKPGGAIPPAGSFYVQVVAMGANPMSQAISWPVGDFTGFYPAAPATAQKGIANDWTGSTAVQIEKGDIGMQIHTASIRARGTIERGLQTITVLRSFPNTPEMHLWKTADAEVEFSIDLRQPKYSMIGASVAYTNLYALLRDTAHPNVKVWIGGGLFDSRPEALRDFVHVDDALAQGGTGYVILHSDLRSGSPYVTSIASTAQRAAWADLRTFKFRIRAADLERGLNQARAQFGSSFPASRLMKDYQLELLALNPEIALLNNTAPHDSWMALSLRNYRGVEGMECFDSERYLAKYPDVAKAVQSGAMKSGEQHYTGYGRYEGRLGCGVPRCTFDEAVYLACNADAKAAVTAGTYSSAWEHYRAVGFAAKKVACKP